MSSRVLVALRIEATPARVFEAFTAEIGQWWRDDPLFQPTRRRGGRMSLEPGDDGRLLVTYADGKVAEVGRLRVWQPPERLVLTWCPTSFSADQETEVHVAFEPVEGGTRVVVEHHGWDAIPAEHVARHGFPLLPFQQRLAEWWQVNLAALGEQAAAAASD